MTNQNLKRNLRAGFAFSILTLKGKKLILHFYLSSYYLIVEFKIFIFLQKNKELIGNIWKPFATYHIGEQKRR